MGDGASGRLVIIGWIAGCKLDDHGGGATGKAGHEALQEEGAAVVGGLARQARRSLGGKGRGEEGEEPLEGCRGSYAT